MKLSISTGDAAIAGEITLLLFNARTVAHILHLSTRSLAQHKALNGFYKGIVDLSDRFAESAIGNYKTLLVWPADKTLGLTTEADPVTYLSAFKEAITSVTSTITEPDLNSILAEILELTAGTLYKLEQLS